MRPIKPWQLCTWTADGQVQQTEAGPQFRRVQTCSYPFPEPGRVGLWINVRMNPGDPTSIATIELHGLETIPHLAKTKIVYLHYAEVFYKKPDVEYAPDNFYFPLDMIRRECCQLEDWTLQVNGPEYFEANRRLRILKVSHASKANWNVSRWFSYSWELEPVVTLVMSNQSGEIIGKKRKEML